MTQHRNCTLSNSQENCNAAGTEQIWQNLQIKKAAEALPPTFANGMVGLKHSQTQISKTQELPGRQDFGPQSSNWHKASGSRTCRAEAEHQTAASICFWKEDLLRSPRAQEKGLKHHTSIYAIKTIKFTKLERRWGGRLQDFFSRCSLKVRQAKTYAFM